MCPIFIVFNTFFCFCRRKELNSQQFYDKLLHFRRCQFRVMKGWEKGGPESDDPPLP